MDSAPSTHSDQRSSGHTWRFAGCEFDESRWELRVRGMAANLEAKPLELLRELLLHAGEVVTKDELLEAVWPGVLVVDGSLTNAVSKLRKALGDDGQMVVTVPRVGYRLDVPVHCDTPRPPTWADLNLKEGDTVPRREPWRLIRRPDLSASSEVWVAQHPKTHENRVFKFAPDTVRLKGLKREVTLARLLRQADGPHPEFVRVLEWNFESPPYFVETEYCGTNLAQWVEDQGGLCNVPLELRLRLLAEVASAIAYAHSLGVLHKDLKPSNILVTRVPGGQWHIKIADFGSASLLDPSRLDALGITNLGFTQTSNMDSMAGTLVYMAPEVFAGQSPTPSADVYALGVLLYQLIAGDFRKPLAPGWEAEVIDAVLRADIAEAAAGNPKRRIRSAAEFRRRLETLDRRRREWVQSEAAEEKSRAAERRQAEVRVRRPWIILAALALLAALAVSLVLYRRIAFSSPRGRTVAVLPFQNVGSDHSLDFLSFALPDEIANTLSYSRALSIRPFVATNHYIGPQLDIRKAAQEMGANTVVTGHYLLAGEQLRISVEAVDIESNRLLWTDSINIPAQSMIGMQEQIAACARGGIAPALGSPASLSDEPARPHNEESYGLYLRSTAVANDPIPNKHAIAMLQRAVDLDPKYSPAWRALAQRYYYESRYSGGGEAMMQRSDAAAERALVLDPNFILARARLAQSRAERGDLAKAYRDAEDLVHQRPDSPDAHFTMSYVLRYAGLLQESAKECEIALLRDPKNPGWRSCMAPYLFRGDYKRAMQFVQLDSGSEWAKTHAIDILVREGKVKEAEQIGPSHIVQWGESYRMLLACAQQRSPNEIVTLAKAVHPVEDPEVNYFFAAHLAYCGQSKAALDMLNRAVKANYCSYPAIDFDPFFASLRAEPEFRQIRSAAISCQKNFLAKRDAQVDSAVAPPPG